MREFAVVILVSLELRQSTRRSEVKARDFDGGAILGPEIPSKRLHAARDCKLAWNDKGKRFDGRVASQEEDCERKDND